MGSGRCPGCGRDAAHALDAVRDPRHASYRLIGLLTWLTLGVSVAGVSVAPRTFLLFARLFAFYLLLRLVVNVAFYLVGVARCSAWERREATATPGECLAEVYHVVIVPNFEEPLALLRRTLGRLAAQEGARQRLAVVLAMEEREPAADEKARALCAEFARCFAHLLVTVHPAGLPGEVAGKGSNQAWAARQARREIVGRLGWPIERTTLTSCDADALLHPRYFAVLTRLFAADPQRHVRFWHAPVFYYNNVWQVPAPIRVMASPSCAIRLGELANPLSWPLPFSTYTLSFELAARVGYWDPAVIAEDWHAYLRCFFATGGRVSLRPIFLPTSVDAVDGASLWQALARYYHQQVRHAWGACDVGYVLQQWRRSPSTPVYRKLACLLWILHHHSLRSVAWFVLALGTLASARVGGTFLVTAPWGLAQPGVVQLANGLGAAGGVVMWAVERARFPRQRRSSRGSALGSELLAWLLLPLLTLAFTALPGLHAQTRMLLGAPLAYRSTPKRVA